MKIFMSGFAADKASFELYEKNKQTIEERFPRFFTEQIKALNKGELNLAKKTACLYACKIGKGGLYAALWHACEELACGCEIYFENIPVKQETIEVAEIFAENPYEMESFGELLFIEDTDEPERIFENEDNIFFIGKTTEAKDRVIVNKENKRFLTPPARQDKDILERRRAGRSQVTE